MDLEKALLKEHSKSQTLKIVKWIGNDPDRFKQLLDLLLQKEYRITQRAAWVVSYVAEEYPDLIQPHLKKVILNLSKPIHDAVKRNTLRVLQKISIPETLLGPTANFCFGFLGSKKEPVAVKVFAMTVLYNISQKYPEIRHELKLLIEEQLELETTAFKSRGKKILGYINKTKGSSKFDN